MLITSRDTRRWVVPKGNLIEGLSDHEAAAHEAMEEAGVRGIPCPSPIGSYRYIKRRRRRPDREMEVMVYPLAFLEQCDDWPEADERDTRWFDLPEAAAAVDETELSQLIASFRVPPPPPGFIERFHSPVRATLSEKIPMLSWFQAMMPKQGRFFEHFEAHAATLVAGAEALAQLLHGGDSMQKYVDAITDREHEADDITREVLQDVRRIFVTPFDRSAISELIGVMDDAIDEMNGTARTITLYKVLEFTPEMRDMSGIIVECARVTTEAIPLLRSLGRNGQRLHELTSRLIELEGHADEIHERGLSALFQACGEAQPMRFIIGREIYSRLERVVDRFEDVANEIQGLVIDHA